LNSGPVSFTDSRRGNERRTADLSCRDIFVEKEEEEEEGRGGIFDKKKKITDVKDKGWIYTTLTRGWQVFLRRRREGDLQEGPGQKGGLEEGAHTMTSL